jgi:hypothetical protein
MNDGRRDTTGTESEIAANRLHLDAGRPSGTAGSDTWTDGRSAVGHDRHGLVLALRYASEAVERVRAIVASEQQCCAFLNFEVREQPDVVHVTITAPENARDAADELFDQFIAADQANQ